MAKVADRQDKANGKQSDKHDGVIEISCCFYSSLSELKTRNKQNEKANHAGFMYLHKKKKKKNIHDDDLKSLVFKREEKKKFLIVNPCHSKINLHIYTPAQPVCGMCLYYDRAT